GIRGVQHPGTTLAQNGEFQGTKQSAEMPNKTQGFLYVNIHSTIPVVERLAHTKLPAAVSRNLKPLRSAMEYAVSRSHEIEVSAIGYTHSEWGFDATTCGVVVALDEQSPDIAQGVDASYELQHDPGDDDPLDRVGAGDQGMMFGYATNETKELMPLPIMLAHKICKRLAEVRKAGELPYLRPDGKAQVTIRYEVDDDGRQRPVEIERVLVSTQHSDGISSEDLIKPDIIERVLHPILPTDLYEEKRLLGDRDFVFVNPTGKFVLGGPMGDTGLTGRKIIVDTYGGAARHGGGAFPGKDPTKV